MATGPIDLLKEELSNDQMYVRINAIHRIPIIATLVGKDGVKRNLLPMIEGKFQKLNFKTPQNFKQKKYEN